MIYTFPNLFGQDANGIGCDIVHSHQWNFAVCVGNLILDLTRPAAQGLKTDSFSKLEGFAVSLQKCNLIVYNRIR